jgi:hypothetical protein
METWEQWAGQWGRTLPTSFSSPLWYPSFLFVIIINSWPRKGDHLSTLLLSSPLCQGPDSLPVKTLTPEGRSKQRPALGHCPQEGYGMPGSCLFHLILALELIIT